jgi:hypothetical protein
MLTEIVIMDAEIVQVKQKFDLSNPTNSPVELVTCPLFRGCKRFDDG